MDKIEKLQKMINECNNIVVFTGAGVSTESGIPDFRSNNGLFMMKYKYPPEVILSHDFFMNHTSLFYEFYREKMNVLHKKGNIVHEYLYNLEKENKLKCIITQNIDGLHVLAGNKNVLEFHGSVYRNYCMKCKKFYTAEYVFGGSGTCRCECGGIIKPDVVLYGEAIDDHILKESVSAVNKCDMLIILGSSLTVYPACNLIEFFKGKYLVIVNRDSTKYDDIADLVINKELKDVFKHLRVK